MATGFIPSADWPSWNNQGAGLAVADLDGNGRPELVVFQIDSPAGANQGFYRIGWNLDAAGTVTGGWSPWIAVPDWFSWENQGADIAVADLDGNGRPELVVFQIDSPAGANQGFYRIGWNLDAAGTVTGGWSPWIAVPDWFSWENQGAGVAIADLDGNSQPELIIFQIDSPAGANQGFYRIGWNLNAAGTVTGGWSPWMVLPGWFSWENQGAGVAIADLDGNGHPELMVFQIDNPEGANQGFYSIGWDLDAAGKVATGWSPWIAVPDWFSWENQGAGVAIADLDGSGHPELIILQIDSPEGPNQGFYRVLDLEVDLDQAAAKGAWRLLPDITQVLPIHAALLHTGKILFFAGSSNNPERAGGDFRSVVWDYTNGSFLQPPTPIDFFCAGHAFLPDGRLLVAGGTKEYDFGHPFFGLRDAFVFDPADEQWKRVADMAGGRWYPTLVVLGDGRVLALSGLGEHGEEPNQDVEVYTDPVGWTVLSAALRARWPLYAHLFLLGDGRLFYSGGQFGVNYDGMPPRLINLMTNTITDGGGLTATDQRNQAASVLLPPAQDQRVMILGGGLSDPAGHHHGTMDATDNVNIIDLTVTHPVYQAAEPLHDPRMHHNAVLLPDRTILVSGGSRMMESRAEATLDAELYNPASHTWTIGARSQVPRLYHSVALLLPDGRGLTAGSNPARADEELRLELYYPPYLFKGPRPVIDAAPQLVTYGEVITIETPQAANIQWIHLIKPSVLTHSANCEQRLVDVPFNINSATTLIASVPNQPNLAPPGWYMLFITDRDGRPSAAAWVRLA